MLDVFCAAFSVAAAIAICAASFARLARPAGLLQRAFYYVRCLSDSLFHAKSADHVARHSLKPVAPCDGRLVSEVAEASSLPDARCGGSNVPERAMLACPLVLSCWLMRSFVPVCSCSCTCTMSAPFALTNPACTITTCYRALLLLCDVLIRMPASSSVFSGSPRSAESAPPMRGNAAHCRSARFRSTASYPVMSSRHRQRSGVAKGSVEQANLQHVPLLQPPLGVRFENCMQVLLGELRMTHALAGSHPCWQPPAGARRTMTALRESAPTAHSP